MLLLTAVFLTLSTLVSLYTSSIAGFISLITAFPFSVTDRRSCCFRGRKTPKLWFLSFPNTSKHRAQGKSAVYKVLGTERLKIFCSLNKYIMAAKHQKLKAHNSALSTVTKKIWLLSPELHFTCRAWTGQTVKLPFILPSLEITLLYT